MWRWETRTGRKAAESQPQGLYLFLPADVETVPDTVSPSLGTPDALLRITSYASFPRKRESTDVGARPLGRLGACSGQAFRRGDAGGHSHLLGQARVDPCLPGSAIFRRDSAILRSCVRASLNKSAPTCRGDIIWPTATAA